MGLADNETNSNVVGDVADVGVAHCYVIFLCSWDDSLVGQLTRCWVAASEMVC